MRAVSTVASGVRHSAVAIAEALLVAAIIAALLLALSPMYKPATFLAGTEQAQAAKGGNKAGAGKGASSSGSVAVVMVVDSNADGSPNWNDTITFDVSTTATDKPWVKLNCYQDGTWVSTGTAGYFEAYPWAPNFTLASGAWLSGAADCVATLYMVTSNGRSKDLGTLSFGVAP